MRDSVKSFVQVTENGNGVFLVVKSLGNKVWKMCDRVEYQVRFTKTELKTNNQRVGLQECSQPNHIIFSIILEKL